MNLTKAMKEEIVAQVIRDVPRQLTDGHTFQKAVTAIIESNVANQLPPEVYPIWADKKLRVHLSLVNGSIIYMLNRSGIVGWNDRPYSGCDTSRPAACSDLLPKFKKQLQELFDKTEAERVVIEAAKSRLTSALAGIRTRKQFIAAFPELEKYAPEEVKPSPMLPALTNVVSDLAKLGWPKTVEATAA
jgi:hypothetical protein